MEGARNCGPYKATKMWNEMVETFQNGIPLRRHRRHIKVYDNCFTGQEAVNWFQSVLQNHIYMGNIVTREQTIQLLNKFLKAGVFQNINAVTTFDPHYQFLKEGDLYHLSDVSSTRLPLASKSLNIPPKSKTNQWPVKNTDGVTKKGITTSCSRSEMAEPQLDARHAVGLPTITNSVMQPTDNKWNCPVSAEEFGHALPLPRQHTRSKSDICARQNMQCGTNYPKTTFTREQKDYGSVHSSIYKVPYVENLSHHGRYNDHYKIKNSFAYEKQVKETSETSSKEYCALSGEQETTDNGHIRSGKTNISSPYNSRDSSKDLGSPRPYTDSCKWLQPLTFESIDTSDMEKGNCIPQPCVPSANLGYKNLENFTVVPKSQTIQRSSSVGQPKLDFSKPSVNTENHDSGKSVRNEKIPHRSVDVSGLTKPQHSEVNSATVRRNPHIKVNNIAFRGENIMGHCGSEDGQQMAYYQTSTSQVKCNRNNVTASRMQEERNPFRTSASLEFSRSGCDDPVTTSSSEPPQLCEIGAIWKKVVLARLEKHTLGWKIPFRYELQTIPGEWLSANASNEVRLDSHFPQSLVAAMNCLVHWPQAVPNEILTAFKEHYFKLQEPLTTFKLYNILTKVFLCVATGNLAVSNRMLSGQSEMSTNGLLGIVLPPNSCFETAFTSDNPVTRIVPQRCVDTLHFSQHRQHIKSVSLKRMSSAPNLHEPLQNIQAAQKGSRQSGTKRQIIGGKRSVKMANKKGGRRVRLGVEEDRKLYHFRSKSGGYVNPALSKSIDDTDTDDFIDTGKIRAQYNIDPEQELDYVAALESLNTLMRCSRRDNPSVAVHRQGIGLEVDIDQNGSQSSESSSYYTAVSSSSSEASSRRSSGVLVDSLENLNTDGLVRMNTGEGGEKLMVTIIQLLLLCIPVYNRIQLQYLLHFMNQWNLHHSLCAQSNVVNIFTPTILRSEGEANFDIALARSIVYFLVSHHELVLSVPSDLEAEVQFLVTTHQRNVVNHKESSVTYCQQVSSQQFEHQRVTVSQLALSELLEQILSDCKMAPKEKRKRLRMFQESYPHIYHRRFPDSTAQDKAEKKQARGLLSLATLSRLKSMRV